MQWADVAEKVLINRTETENNDGDAAEKARA